MHNAFAIMLRYFFIVCNYKSSNIQGKLLSILTIKLTIINIKLVYSVVMWQYIKNTKAKVCTQQKDAYIQSLRKQQAAGTCPNKKLAVLNLANSNPNAFLVACIISCLPNLIPALVKQRKANLGAISTFNNLNSLCLGKANNFITQALRTSATIQTSFIQDIALTAYRGLAKVDFLNRYMQCLQSKKTIFPIVIKDSSKQQVLFQSKIVMSTSI